MRGLIWVVLACAIMFATGCNEFMASEKSAPISVVDVVGDPADPVPDSYEQSDILGAENRATAESVVEVASESDENQPEEGDTDLARGIDSTKPTSIKTTNRGTSTQK